MRSVYKRRQAGEKYKPSYNLETVYTNQGASENLGYSQEKKATELQGQNEKDSQKKDGKDGNKNTVTTVKT